MKLDIRAFALAVGAVTAAVFTICAFFVAIAPETTRAFFSYLFHIDLSGMASTISWGSFIAGLLGTGLGMAFLAGAVAWIYNRLSRS
ncbi:MAG: hypothetical protein HY203_04715 [Nitrospirae bacterium]|nr:hypothetical protein [Nitrospirota bacterium]